VGINRNISHEAKPEYFVTGDNHFLKNPELEETLNLRIIAPAQLIRTLETNSR
jgi:hypothetical protein